MAEGQVLVEGWTYDLRVSTVKVGTVLRCRRYGTRVASTRLMTLSFWTVVEGI